MKNWRNSASYQDRLEILNKKIKMSKLEELRAEVAEMEQAKQDLLNKPSEEVSQHIKKYSKMNSSD